jgi:hypothetical protein
MTVGMCKGTTSQRVTNVWCQGQLGRDTALGTRWDPLSFQRMDPKAGTAYGTQAPAHAGVGVLLNGPRTSQGWNSSSRCSSSSSHIASPWFHREISTGLGLIFVPISSSTFKLKCSEACAPYTLCALYNV